MRASALLALGLAVNQRRDPPQVQLDAPAVQRVAGLRDLEPAKVQLDAAAQGVPGLRDLEPALFQLARRPGGPGKIAAVIATHDRIGYVQLCALALKGTIPEEDVFVLDDNSTEYGVPDLQQWFGAKANVVRKRHEGAGVRTNHAMKFIYEETDYDYVAIVDSDLVVEPTWRKRVLEALQGEKDDAWFSMYHSGLHPTLDCGETVCSMKDLGYAGSVFSRSFLARVLPSVDVRDLDWGVVGYCREHGIPFRVLKDSAVEHVGQHGLNAVAIQNMGFEEKAVGFPLESLDAKLRGVVKQFLAGDEPSKLVFSSSQGRYEAGPPNHETAETRGDVAYAKRLWEQGKEFLSFHLLPQGAELQDTLTF